MMDTATAYAVFKKYGALLNAFGALCQCYHETAGFTSELCLKANNCAGIKCGSGWSGEIYERESWEQHPDGTKYDKKSAFRRYASFEDFVRDYAEKIQKNYPSCSTDNFFGFFAGLGKGRYGSWATDLKYFDRLCESAIKLAPEIFGVGQLWRNKLLDAFEYALEKGYLSKEQATSVYSLLKPSLQPERYEKELNTVGGGIHVVCLDAGHGGRDPGACASNLREKNITMQLCQLLGRELVKRGYDVHYTRVVDEYLGLQERGRIANKAKAEAFISIHCNAASNAAAGGFEIWTTKGHTRADLLATDILNAYVSLDGGKTRQDTSDGDPDKENNWTVLSASTMPAVLIEAQFISNAEDRTRLLSSEWREKFAGAVANGLDKFFARG